jgi:hypothetical protein
MYYAGIGSRQSPKEVLSEMTEIAKRLDSKYILRSGGAEGADKAFEAGATNKQIFSPKDLILKWAFDMVAELVVEQSWGTTLDKMKPFVQRLIARNMMIMLGANGDEPVKFVICWTPDGKVVGGTAWALRLAAKRNIQIYNLFFPNRGFLPYLV